MDNPKRIIIKIVTDPNVLQKNMNITPKTNIAFLLRSNCHHHPIRFKGWASSRIAGWRRGLVDGQL